MAKNRYSYTDAENFSAQANSVRKTGMSATEHQEQVALLRWWRLFPGKEEAQLLAIPNGGKRTLAMAAWLKAEGMTKGVPDLFLAAGRRGCHGLWIEMKRADGKPSDVRPEQKAMLQRLREAGYGTAVCFGWKQAADAIEQYLK